MLSNTTTDLSYEDDGGLVESFETIFEFSNGAIIKKLIEFEKGDLSHDTCQERWISYEVVSNPEKLTIKPSAKNFINICQESFWLKMSVAHAST